MLKLFHVVWDRIEFEMMTEPRPTAIAEESLGALVDLARYPIDNPNDLVCINLVESCKRQLATSHRTTANGYA